MTSTIHLVRHAESEHNISKDFSHPDPSLTSTGTTQAAHLTTTFPHPDRIALVLTSPLRRAVQTALAGFSHVLDERYFAGLGAGGVRHGVPLVLEPELQERSAEPCDTGSSAAQLTDLFPGVDVSVLSEGWEAKTGAYAADDEAVGRRAARMREKLGVLSRELQGKERRDIVVVTHGVFMKFLSGEEDIDLPKAGWRSYVVAEKEGDGEVVLTAEID